MGLYFRSVGWRYQPKITLLGTGYIYGRIDSGTKGLGENESLLG